MNEWIPVADRVPDKKGRYLTTTVNLKTGERVVSIGTYKGDEKWGSPYVIAWKDVFGFEPYLGKSILDDKSMELKTKREAVKMRRKKVFELRLKKMSFPDIAKETGVTVTTVRADINKYLDKCKSGKCLQCEHSDVNTGDKWHPCYCELLKIDVYGRWSCDMFKELKSPRVTCSECRYIQNRGAFYGDPVYRCCRDRKEIWFAEDCTCQRAERNEE